VFLLKLTCTYKTEASAAKNTKLLAIKIKQSFGEGVVVFGPAPAFYERLHNTYRWQLIIKSSKRESLINIINLVPKTHWQYELDPYSLI
jgi:primosomal protein N' (replication factor Y)